MNGVSHLGLLERDMDTVGTVRCSVGARRQWKFAKVLALGALSKTTHVSLPITPFDRPATSHCNL